MAAIGKMLHKRRNRHLIVRTACTPAITQKSFPLIHTRSNNAHVPKAPHRRLQSDSPTALGVGKVYNRILLAEKPIVRSPRPSKFNECLRADNEAAINSDRSRSRQTTEAERLPSIICDDHVKLLSTKRLYTSTTREATEEAALSTPRRNVPLTTLEREADPVRCRAVRYWPRPNVWQHYAREWDAMQLRRSPDSDNVDNDLTLPHIGKNYSVLLQNNNDLRETESNRTPREFVFLRPMPGYGGFVPRHAVEPSNHTEADCISDWMCSTARRTYRTLPASEYRVLEHAHKGPFSKTVTMTHPLNPFN